MCFSPVRIKNPQFYDVGVRNYTSKDYNTSNFDELFEAGANAHNIYRLQLAIDNQETQTKNVSQEYIYVPCGHCAECVRRKQNEIVQRAYFESLGKNTYFVTLTYDDKHLPYYNDAFGRRFTYASHKDFRYLVKLLRKNLFDKRGISFKYFVCSERGKKRHRPHFHALFFCDPQEVNLDTGEMVTYDAHQFNNDLMDAILLYWSINKGTRKNPDYSEKKFKYVKNSFGSNFDCHLVEPYRETNTKSKDYTSVAYYVSKYATKSDPYESKLAKLFFKPFYATQNPIVIAESKRIWRILSSHGTWSRGFGNTAFAHSVYNKAIEDFYKSSDPEELVPNFYLSVGLSEAKHFSCCSYLIEKTLGKECYHFGNFIMNKSTRTDFDLSYDPENIPQSVLARRRQLGNYRTRRIIESQYGVESLLVKPTYLFNDEFKNNLPIEGQFSIANETPDFTGLFQKYETPPDDWQWDFEPDQLTLL